MVEFARYGVSIGEFGNFKQVSKMIMVLPVYGVKNDNGGVKNDNLTILIYT